MMVWCFTPFSTIFQLFRGRGAASGGQCTYSCFPGVLSTSTQYTILSKHLFMLSWSSFNQYSVYYSFQAPIHAFLEFFQPVLSILFFPSHWLVSNRTIVKTMDSSDGGMNPVTMTIINPWKEY